MLNQVVLVGRIKEINEDRIIILVTRNFKNEDGNYETDIIPCYFKETISKNANEYCKVGDTVGIKGRIESLNNEVMIMVDKLTFLSTKNKNE